VPSASCVHRSRRACACRDPAAVEKYRNMKPGQPAGGCRRWRYRCAPHGHEGRRLHALPPGGPQGRSQLRRRLRLPHARRAQSNELTAAGELIRGCAKTLYDLCPTCARRHHLGDSRREWWRWRRGEPLTARRPMAPCAPARRRRRPQGRPQPAEKVRARTRRAQINELTAAASDPRGRREDAKMTSPDLAPGGSI
jgi:hypothetical protein